MKYPKGNWRIYCDTLEEVQECIEDPDFIRPILIQGCKDLLSSRRRRWTAELQTLDTYATVEMTIRRDEIPSVLQRILDGMIEDERYEECAEIGSLLERALRSKTAQQRRHTGGNEEVDK